jgi:hypothetical protein
MMVVVGVGIAVDVEVAVWVAVAVGVGDGGSAVQLRCYPCLGEPVALIEIAGLFSFSFFILVG